MDKAFLTVGIFCFCNLLNLRFTGFKQFALLSEAYRRFLKITFVPEDLLSVAFETVGFAEQIANKFTANLT